MFSIRQRIVNPRPGPLLWIRPSIMCYRFSERFSRKERKGRKEKEQSMRIETERMKEREATEELIRKLGRLVNSKYRPFGNAALLERGVLR